MFDYSFRLLLLFEKCDEVGKSCPGGFQPELLSCGWACPLLLNGISYLFFSHRIVVGL